LHYYLRYIDLIFNGDFSEKIACEPESEGAASLLAISHQTSA